MATVTIRNRSRRIPPNDKQRAARLAATTAAYADDVARDKRERAAIAELRRNGIEPPEEKCSSAKLFIALDKRPGVPEQTGCIEDIDIEVRPFRRREEFTSRADARPMNKADICNVQILTTDDVAALTNEFKEAAPSLYKHTRAKIDAEWAGLLDDSERYALTAYAMRKLRREKVVK